MQAWSPYRACAFIAHVILLQTSLYMARETTYTVHDHAVPMICSELSLIHFSVTALRLLMTDFGSGLLTTALPDTIILAPAYKWKEKDQGEEGREGGRENRRGKKVM